MDIRKETGPLLPNKWFLGNTSLRKHQVLKEIHLHCVGKNAHIVPRATSLMYCRVKTSEVHWKKSKSEISPSVTAADNDKFGAVLPTGTCPCHQIWGTWDVEPIPWNAVQITYRRTSHILHKEGIYWYMVIWKPIHCSPCSTGKMRLLFKLVFR